LGPSQKTFRPTWCPKLVTGLVALDGLREREVETFLSKMHSPASAANILSFFLIFETLHWSFQSDVTLRTLLAQGRRQDVSAGGAKNHKGEPHF